MTHYKVYLSVFLISILVIGSTAVAARYFQDMNTAKEKINSLGSQ